MPEVGIVTGETANLPPDFIAKHHIQVVPFPVWFPDEGEEIKDLEILYHRMRDEEKIPKTSAPPPARFRRAYLKALEEFDRVLVITVNQKWSGAYDSAQRGREGMKDEERKRIHIFDSHLAATAQGAVVWKAQELAGQGMSAEEIIGDLDEFRKKVKLFGVLEDLIWVVRGGRLHEPWATPALAIQKAGVRPAIGVSKDQIKLTGLKLFSRDVVTTTLNELKRGVRRMGKKGVLKAAVAHGALEEERRMRLCRGIKELGELLFEAYLTPLVGSHIGPGSIVVGYFFE